MEKIQDSRITVLETLKELLLTEQTINLDNDVTMLSIISKTFKDFKVNYDFTYGISKLDIELIINAIKKINMLNLKGCNVSSIEYNHNEDLENRVTISVKSTIDQILEEQSKAYKDYVFGKDFNQLEYVHYNPLTGEYTQQSEFDELNKKLNKSNNKSVAFDLTKLKR